MAGAAYKGRSPPSETVAGLLQVWPPSRDQMSFAVFALRSEPPSAHASRISLDAFVPLGAPFAMSTLGPAERSVRAPANPSMTHRPYTGSTKKQGSVFCRMICAFVKLWPPSVDVNMTWKPCVGSPTSVGFSNISANTWTTRVLSVRMVHPLSPNRFGPLPLVPAGVICFVLHVLPPSAENENVSGTGKVPPRPRCCPTLRNSGLQT